MYYGKNKFCLPRTAQTIFSSSRDWYLSPCLFWQMNSLASILLSVSRSTLHSTLLIDPLSWIVDIMEQVADLRTAFDSFVGGTSYHIREGSVPYLDVFCSCPPVANPADMVEILSKNQDGRQFPHRGKNCPRPQATSHGIWPSIYLASCSRYNEFSLSHHFLASCTSYNTSRLCHHDHDDTDKQTV